MLTVVAGTVTELVTVDAELAKDEAAAAMITSELQRRLKSLDHVRTTGG